MHSGPHGSDSRGKEGANRRGRRLPRERAVVEGTASGRGGRGLVIDPKLATGDGALGFWKALDQVYPSTRAQRCWVHKTANVLDKMPKRIQPGAKDALHQIWMAEKKEHAQAAFDLFLATYQAKYPKACECLSKDRDQLLTRYCQLLWMISFRRRLVVV